MIVAIAENNAIGKDNKLLWRLPSDLKRFRQITKGKTIIMGRKTFESLPRLLPERKHIVISKNFEHDDVHVEHDISSLASGYASSDDEVFIIGGASVYEYMLPFSKKIYLTKVYRKFEADTFLNLDFSGFEIVNKSGILTENGIDFQYFDYDRITADVISKNP